MIVSTAYKGKTIGVFGLARTGVAVVDALRAGGATVYAWDDSAEKVASVGDAAHNLYEADFKALDGLVMAPGVPLTHPEPHALVIKAHENDVPVIGDFDLFAWAQPEFPAHKTVAITGTNGKSTTTALIHHMLDSCGVEAVMAGNIGTGILSLEPLSEGGVYVFEMSSYQIDLTHDFRPDVTVLLNISPDHLDRHGGMAGYVAAKTRLFSLQEKSGGTAVVSVDDSYCSHVAGILDKPVTAISAEKRLHEGVYVCDGLLFEAHDGKTLLIGTVADVATLRGKHNWQNVAAAYAVGQSLGLEAEDMLQAFHSFPGLAHRQERVAEIDGVTYINDSKATNVEAAGRALASYTSVHWIAGGRAKEENIQALMPFMSHVKQAYLIGESADMIAAGLPEHVDCSLSGSLDIALESARQNAVVGDVVILSPACSAFDQFDNFEHRGDAFRAKVQAMEGGQS